MTRSRFLTARFLAARFLAARVFIAARALAFALPTLALLGARPLWAQTAPVFEAPPATGASTSGGASLLENAFDFDPEAVDAPRPSLQTPPSSFSVAQDAAASGARALSWKYTLSRDEARLSWSRVAPLDLSSARSIGLKIKSGQPTAVEIWFETDAQGEGADSFAARYSTTVWSTGDSWQQVSLDRARLIGHEIKGGVLQKEPIPSGLWDAGWSHIARWGVADSSNFWRLFAGQGRATGLRTLWLDDLRISTAASPNSVTPPPAPPRPVPQPLPDNGEQGDEDGAAGGADNGLYQGNRGGQGDRGDGRQPLPRAFPQRLPQDAPALEAAQVFRIAEGGEGAEEQGGDPGAQGGAAPAEIEVQAVVQDAWGAPENWIPINGTTEALGGTRAGLKWSVVRLANRDAMLISPVNPEMLRAFPPESARKPVRGADVVIQGSADRILRLAIAVTSAKPTLVQVALHESGGGVWTALVPLDMRRKNFVPIVRLSEFINAPTRRDANGQIDLDRIIAVSLQDIGAQKNLAGPNELQLHGMTWIY